MDRAIRDVATSRLPVRGPALLRTIVFVVGAASLGAEIAAARLLAPYFGASTIIWANTIATVLVALSAGYAIGGRLADRRADLRGLCMIVLLAAVLLAMRPVRRRSVPAAVGQRARIAVGGRVSRLAGGGAGAGGGPGDAAGRGGPVRQPPDRGERGRDRHGRPGACTRSRPPARWWGRSSRRCC